MVQFIVLGHSVNKIIFSIIYRIFRILMKLYEFSDGTTKDYCCYGYCIDLIHMIAKKLHFEYEIYMVPDGLYGDMVS